MKHSKYDELYNFMSGNGKANMDKKSGNNKLSTLIDNFNDKIKFLSKLTLQKYEDDSFYLLRHEIDRLHKSFLIKENVLFSESNIFSYLGKKYECEPMNLSLHHGELILTNRRVVFHDFYRDTKTGDIMVSVKVLN